MREVLNMPEESKGILHLVTQDGQPYGSRRKCCEECGKGIHRMRGVSAGDAYTNDRDFYQNAEAHGWTPCSSLTIDH
jgi:hypothetical protein